MTDYLNQLLSQYQRSNQKKRAFISFDFDNDENLRNLLNGQSKNTESPFYFEDWSVKTPFPQSVWIPKVRGKIKKCSFMIVIIGSNTYRCPGVIAEIKIANEENIPCFGIYKQGERYYVPEGLGKRYIPWVWDEIASAINNLNLYYPLI